jgi:uncharacterized membrane protein
MGTDMQANQPEDHLRFHTPHLHLARTFGGGSFGAFAETTARLFGTPMYLGAQTVAVIVWIILNSTGVVDFDLYPFILLNLAFSLQAAYAAPLILLAETRQAERDKSWSAADAMHREELSRTTLMLLEENTNLTREVKALTEHVNQLTAAVHERLVRDNPA